MVRHHVFDNHLSAIRQKNVTSIHNLLYRLSPFGKLNDVFRVGCARTGANWRIREQLKNEFDQ